MSKRTRRILLRAVVILGAVLPFVLGAISERLLPLVSRHSTSIESADRPGDDQEVWYGFGSKSVPVDRTGIKYWLDCQRALADAKSSKKPALLYFTGINDANAVHIHLKVLRAPAVIARLRQFECAVLFVDAIPSPYTDRAEANRMVEQNGKLVEELLGVVPVPGFAVVQPDFDNPAHPEARQPLVTADLFHLRDEATAVQTLDEALETWSQWRATPAESRAHRIRHSKDNAGRIHVEMDDKPDNLVLLVSHPEAIEPELTRGRWLVLLYSLLSSDSVRAAINSPDLAQQLTDISQVAIRPTMDFEETRKWLPDFERYSMKGHPFWFIIEDGIVIRRYEGWMDNKDAAQFAEK